MAINTSDLLHTHQRDHRLSPDVYQGMCSLATYTRDVEESKQISADRNPKIILSASGMATGGRVLHHLRLRPGSP